jgi:hypothetical protein
MALNPKKSGILTVIPHDDGVMQRRYCFFYEAVMDACLYFAKRGVRSWCFIN